MSAVSCVVLESVCFSDGYRLLIVLVLLVDSRKTVVMLLSLSVDTCREYFFGLSLLNDTVRSFFSMEARFFDIRST